MKTVIFDFGNVVAFFDHWKTLNRLTHLTDMPAKEMFDTVYVGQLEDDFESGKINDREFLDHVIQLCRLKCDRDFLAKSIADIFEPNPEVCDLIDRLHGKVRLVLGSNTNPVHAAHFVTQFEPILSRFDGIVMSHQVGARKPRPEFFAACHRHAGGRPDESVFIDDLPANIAGAEAFGFRSIVYRAGDDLAGKLRALGVAL
ncbi:MAG: HAD family phosphatase [Gemmataceae bacterium]|nr:HAD family phosphatase [Gemmataceae bacterium]